MLKLYYDYQCIICLYLSYNMQLFRRDANVSKLDNLNYINSLNIFSKSEVYNIEKKQTIFII